MEQTLASLQEKIEEIAEIQLKNSLEDMKNVNLKDHIEELRRQIQVKVGKDGEKRGGSIKN